MAGAGQRLKALVRRLANLIGYDIVGYDGSNARARLAALLAYHRIGLILDVGANEGAFGWDMRELGYKGRIVSFEPMAEAFARLETSAATDPAWEAVHLGLGDADAERIIHVAANSQSSSLLPMLDAHAEAAPESSYKGEEQVSVRRLDGLIEPYRLSGSPIFLKIDTQGFERPVLDGAKTLLPQVKLLQLECSLVALYDGAELIEDMTQKVRELGYDPVDILPTFRHRGNQHLMQTDILFVRRGA